MPAARKKQADEMDVEVRDARARCRERCAREETSERATREVSEKIHRSWKFADFVARSRENEDARTRDASDVESRD